MEDNYLWDRSGKPDPEVQELEEILGQSAISTAATRDTARYPGGSAAKLLPRDGDCRRDSFAGRAFWIVVQFQSAPGAGLNSSGAK